MKWIHGTVSEIRSFETTWNYAQNWTKNCVRMDVNILNSNQYPTMHCSNLTHNALICMGIIQIDAYCFVF